VDCAHGAVGVWRKAVLEIARDGRDALVRDQVSDPRLVDVRSDLDPLQKIERPRLDGEDPRKSTTRAKRQVRVCAQSTIDVAQVVLKTGDNAASSSPVRAGL
jgi:hypothetical protein